MTPARERKAQERARKRALGLVRRDVWAYPEDWPAVYALAAHLRAAREVVADAPQKGFSSSEE